MNDVRLQASVQWELSDGDTLTFGSQSKCGRPEFYFLFQKVRVRPLDFDAITIPKAGSFSSDIQNRIRTSLDRKTAANLDLSTLSINRATVILNSIGSLSKMKGSPWTFKRSDSNTSDPSSNSPPPFSLLPPSTPPPFSHGTSSAMSSSKSVPPSSKSRRKSAHTVLLEDDSSDEPRNPGGGLGEGLRPRGKKRRRLYKSESEGPMPPPSSKIFEDGRFFPEVRQPFDFKNRPTIGNKQIRNCHGAVANVKQNHVTFSSNKRRDMMDSRHRIGSHTGITVSTLHQQKAFSTSASRGRRRAHNSPAYSPLVVGGENYTLASPSLRICKEERGRAQFARFHVASG